MTNAAMEEVKAKKMRDAPHNKKSMFREENKGLFEENDDIDNSQDGEGDATDENVFDL